MCMQHAFLVPQLCLANMTCNFYPVVGLFGSGEGEGWWGGGLLLLCHGMAAACVMAAKCLTHSFPIPIPFLIIII